MSENDIFKLRRIDHNKECGTTETQTDMWRCTMLNHNFIKENLPRLILMGITAVLITVTGVVYGQTAFRILPLYLSLVIAFLQSRANRYASLFGGFNAILYAAVYLYLKLYASCFYTLLFSCPIQFLTFAQWSRRKYKESTAFRTMTKRQRVYTAVGFLFLYGALCLILRSVGSDYRLLDSLAALLGVLISVLTMFAFVEYTWLLIPSGIVSICLDLSVTFSHPEQITYVIFSCYSFVCAIIGFRRVRRLYAEQTEASRGTPVQDHISNEKRKLS